MAGIVAAGAIGTALAVGGVAYAAGDPDTGNSEQIVRVVEEGTPGDRGDCPDKGGSGGETPSENSESSGENL
jgi:hypothetical protein